MSSARQDFPPIPNGSRQPGGWGLLHHRMCDEIDVLRRDLELTRHAVALGVDQIDYLKAELVRADKSNRDLQQISQTWRSRFLGIAEVDE